MDSKTKDNKAAEYDDSWLRLLPETSPLLIGYMGADRRHRYVNTAYANWFLKKPEELINKTLKELAYDPASYAAVEPYETRALSGERVDFVVRLPVPIEGDIDSFQCHFIPHIDEKTGRVLGMVSVAQSMTQHERLKKEVEGSEHRYRSFTNAIPQLMWTAKANGEVDYVNQRCLDYTGKSPETIADNWMDTFHPDDLASAAAAWEISVKTGADFKLEYRIQDQGGHYRWFLGHAVPIHSKDGEVQYWIGTATDIEEERKKNEELKRAKIAAEDANHAKNAFLANISHELRTPLSAVLGFSRLLCNKEISDSERQQFINTIERNGKMLTRIIDDLLDMTRIEAGRVVVDKVKFSPRDLLGEVVELFKEKASEKKIDLDLFVDENVPKYVVSDPVRLRQIMINIIGNAVKFTVRGGVRVQLTTQPLSESNLELHFEVKDTGCGFTKEECDQLFVPFYQTDSTAARRFGGAGLGLSISQRLAAALGGKIQVTEFGVNKGATFLVSIAARLPHPKEKSVSEHYAGGVGDDETVLNGLRCLVVDDAVDNQYLVKYILESVGAKADVASSGSEALVMLDKVSYDLVLLDIQMPVMDGYQTLNAIRKKGFEMPVIAVTAHATKDDMISTISAGFSHHLTKPLNFEALIRVLGKLR